MIMKNIQEESLKKKKFIEQDYILFLDMGYPIPYDNTLAKRNPLQLMLNIKIKL